MAGSPAIGGLRLIVESYLRASFEHVLADPEGMAVKRGGVPAFVDFVPINPEHTAVVVWSASNVEVSVDTELTTYLATEGNQLAFGQFQLYEPDARVHISHALLGEFLGPDELAMAVAAVIEATAYYGPVIEERFGGSLPFEPHPSAGPDLSTGRTSGTGTDGSSHALALDDQRALLELGLRDVFPQVGVDEEGDFRIPHPGGPIWVRLVPWTEGRTLARVWSITNLGVQLEGELSRFLLTSNARILLSGFRLDASAGAVMLVHYLLGSPVNLHELRTAVAYIGADTGRYGPEIKARFGGTLFAES
jgi:hypothetical protein